MTRPTNNVAIIVVVERGKADIIVDTATKAGAPGG